MGSSDPFELLLAGDFVGALATKFNPNHDDLGRFASGPGGNFHMAPDTGASGGGATGGAQQWESGSTVDMYGARFQLVSWNANGTARVRNDNGDEFDTEPGDKLTLVSGPKGKQSKPKIPDTEDEYVRQELSKVRQSRQETLDKIRQEISDAYKGRGVSLPAGISPWQHLASQEKPRGPLRDLATRLRVAERNLESDTRADERTHREVYRLLRGGQGRESRVA
jgi:hypothetical protein